MNTAEEVQVRKWEDPVEAANGKRLVGSWWSCRSYTTASEAVDGDVVRAVSCRGTVSARRVGSGRCKCDLLHRLTICGECGARNTDGARRGSRRLGRRDPFSINSHQNATSEHLNSISTRLMKTRIGLAATVFSRYEKRLNRFHSGLEHSQN